MADKKTFDIKINDKETKFAVLKPNPKVRQKAEQVKSKAFREAVEAGAILRAKVEKVMEDQKLWDEDKQKRYEALAKCLLEAELKLAKGGITKSKARELAIQMRRDRFEFRQLNIERQQLDTMTAEAQAENAYFNYLVSACTYYEDGPNEGKSYFRDYDEYLSKDDDPVTLEASLYLGRMLYGLEDDFESKLPENIFLKKYGFVNDKLHLINKDGKLIDSRGRLVNENGELINEKNERVDVDGNPLTDDGKYKVEFQEFLEDEPAQTA